MWNTYKIIVFMIVISISKEIEITTFEPTNSTVEFTTTAQETQFVLNQTSVRPTFHPNSGGIAEIIPPSSPLPDSPNPTTSNNEIFITTTEDYVKSQTVLEYKPLNPFHQPLPIKQIVSPGKPWPVSAEQNETVKPTTLPIQTFPQDLVERFPELTTLNKITSTPNVINNKKSETVTNKYVKPITVVSYKPITSFHHPFPDTLTQIVPPGKPLPASAEGYDTTKDSSLEATWYPEFTSRKTTTTKTSQSKKTKVPLSASRKTTTKPSTYKQTTVFDFVTTEDNVKPTTVLEYVPTTTFFHPHPVTLPQIVPPGKPWPASAEDYQTTKDSSLEDLHDPELTSKNITTKQTSVFSEVATDKTTQYVESQTILEYKPITSFHHPHPVTIAQLVPPGKPWPASAEETKTDPSAVTQSPSQTLAPNLIDRFPELVSIKTTTTKPTKSPVTASSTRLTLTYKPQRPWYHPRPGNTVSQIVPPGKPWPSSPSGYPSFTVTTLPPWFKESVDKDGGDNELSLPHYKGDELQSLKEEPSLEPNALQYYGPFITARPMYNIAETPFTSGTQKTTISDIVDILKEVHNISLVSGNAAPRPSHLLPFDVDKGSSPDSSGVRRPQSQGHQRQKMAPVQVYDGAINFEVPTNRERIFTNPRLVPQH